MDTMEKLTLDAIQAMLQTMLAQQENMRSDNQKVHERLARLEIATPIQPRETKFILFNELEEEADEEGSTRANKQDPRWEFGINQDEDFSFLREE